MYVVDLRAQKCACTGAIAVEYMCDSVEIGRFSDRGLKSLRTATRVDVLINE